jgi:uncharacterized protein with beta-barrel porin domain
MMRSVGSIRYHGLAALALFLAWPAAEAMAKCTPAAVAGGVPSNTTVTCMGTVSNQNGNTGFGKKPYSRLAWAHDFDNEGASTAFFQSLPGATFLINSAKPARDSALTTVGFEYKLADGWSVLDKFDGEFSSTTAIFAGTGTIRKVW